MNTPAPKTTTAPDEALSSLMGAALDVPTAPEQPEVPAWAPDNGQPVAPVITQDGMAPHDVLLSVWNAMQNAADGNDLLSRLEHMRGSIARAASAPTAGDAQIDRDAAFEAVRKHLCAIPRYSFYLDDDGGVRRVKDRSGHWIEFDAAHELFDPVCVDAAIAAQRRGDA